MKCLIYANYSKNNTVAYIKCLRIKSQS